MKLGAVNNYNRDISDEIKLIASEGFDFVDLTLEPIFAGRLDAGKVKAAVEETGIEIIGHTSPFLPVIFPLKTIRKASIDEFQKYIDFFSKLGVKLMNVHPSLNGTLMTERDMMRNNREFITELNGLCREKGLTLMVENVLSPFNTPESFEELLEGLDDVKVHIDIGHCHVNTDRNLVDEFFVKFGKRIVHAHFSDNFGNRDDHLPLGCGTINWKDMVGILRKHGYDETITLEIFSQDRRYLLLSKKYLEDISGR
ncbi:MAG: sugar phosphate isomerase/epimerase [Elusimicrobia bacterium]|nr:sugar phosphate isomerase/epimerase [Elusimicrobiota bacterium]